MNSSNTYTESMQLGSLRGTPVYDELIKNLRQFSLLISPDSYLDRGGSGILVKYKGRVGILTATHVMVDNLDSKKIFSPFIATDDPTFFLNEGIPIKGIIYVDSEEGLRRLAKPKPHPYPEDTLDICLIELDADVFKNILDRSGKTFVDLSFYQEKYSSNFDSYCCSNHDWCWAIEGSPRENSKQDDNNIFHSRYDGLYVSGGSFKTTPLIHVHPSFDRMADLCIHQFGPTTDSLPNNFEGISGAGVWQVAFAGADGIPTDIHEVFFSGILVCGSEQEMIASRGPTSLYDIFLKYVDTLSE